MDRMTSPCCGSCEQLGLTGSKFGCRRRALRSLHDVHLDGAATRTCVLPISGVEGKRVTTIEGLSRNNDHPVQKAWIDLDVPQCGYCQSGMIMAVSDLLNRKPHPTDQDIDQRSPPIVFCRCATYVPHPARSISQKRMYHVRAHSNTRLKSKHAVAT